MSVIRFGALARNIAHGVGNSLVDELETGSEVYELGVYCVHIIWYGLRLLGRTTLRLSDRRLLIVAALLDRRSLSKRRCSGL